METNKVTLVTGEPRSGTSLMMQILKALGVPIAGRQFPGNHTRKWMNPDGFYEVPGMVMRGFGLRKPAPSWLRGKAVKVVTRGVVPSKIGGVDWTLVDKAILCLRHPAYIAESQRDLKLNFNVDVGSKEWVRLRNAFSVDSYMRNMGAFMAWLLDHPEQAEKILVVDYDELVNHPGRITKQVCDHLKLTPTFISSWRAVHSVKPDLRRSDKVDPPAQSKWLDVAVSIYEAVKSRNESRMRTAMNVWSFATKESRMESVRWLDEETWTFIDSSMQRSLNSNRRGCRDKLKAAAAVRQKGMLLSFDCPHYSRTGVYSVQRPDDLGPLVRQQVSCGRDGGELKTVEACQSCWLMTQRREEIRRGRT